MMYQKTTNMGSDSLALLLEYIAVNGDNDDADKFPNHPVPSTPMARTELFVNAQCF